MSLSATIVCIHGPRVVDSVDDSFIETATTFVHWGNFCCLGGEGKRDDVVEKWPNLFSSSFPADRFFLDVVVDVVVIRNIIIFLEFFFYHPRNCANHTNRVNLDKRMNEDFF